MRDGWRPERRSRNIGTKRQGHGKNNSLTIPEAWDESRCYYEQLTQPVAVVQSIAGHKLTFLVEAPRPGWLHASTVQDISAVLQEVPRAHIASIDLIILRQPTQKQALLSPVWGRLIYYAEPKGYSGTAIYLEAQSPANPIVWPTSLTPDSQRELERLRADGHRIVTGKRCHTIHCDPGSIRATQLFRTLLHEVGHYVDYLTHYMQPAENQTDEIRDQLASAYWSKPQQDKEAFAHRYADERYQDLRAKGLVPFEKLWDEDAMQQAGLQREWFGVTTTGELR